MRSVEGAGCLSRKIQRAQAVGRGLGGDHSFDRGDPFQVLGEPVGDVFSICGFCCRSYSVHYSPLLF